MKSKCFAVLIAVIYCFSSQAQNTIPPKTDFVPPAVHPNISKVFSVTASIDSITTPSSTGKDIYLKVVFTSMGSGTINFTLTDVNRSASGVATTNTTHTLTPGGTGTDVFYIKRSTFVRSIHTYTITTTAPNAITSNSI
jgi:hypothetical protein